MAQNDKVLLDQIIEDRKNKIAPEMSTSDFFELFVAGELLKSYELDYQEIEAGVVDGGNDGGIDSLFAFVDGELVTSTDDLSTARDSALVELVVIQSKHSTGFQESALNSLIVTFGELLNMEADINELSTAYNAKVISVFNDFREVIAQLASKFPLIRFRFFYITKGDSAHVHPNVTRRRDVLKDKIGEFFSEFQFSFDFLGAHDLLAIIRRQAKHSLNLRIVESLTAEGEGIICLVRLKDYFGFISDESGQRRQNIFDSNVREYEGDVDVNIAIRHTLENPDAAINFWWLNNGITVVAKKAPLTSKTLTLEDPKVVNGLQTSQEIYSFFSRQPSVNDNRLILVRVIVTEDDEIRNRILQATNNQTRIPAYALRAADEIHRNIEQFFGYKGYFYDRQKNYYKLLGKPRRKIVSIQYVAQAFTAVALQRPNDARGRPTNLIKDDTEYGLVFSTNYDVEVYLKCAKLQQSVDEFLRKMAPANMIAERTNLRFGLSYFLAALATKNQRPNHELIAAELDVENIDNAFIRMCSDHVWDVLKTLRKARRLPSDRIAKNKEFDEELIKRVGKVLSGDSSLGNGQISLLSPEQ